MGRLDDYSLLCHVNLNGLMNGEFSDRGCPKNVTGLSLSLSFCVGSHFRLPKLFPQAQKEWFLFFFHNMSCWKYIWLVTLSYIYAPFHHLDKLFLLFSPARAFQHLHTLKATAGKHLENQKNCKKTLKTQTVPLASLLKAMSTRTRSCSWCQQQQYINILIMGLIHWLSFLTCFISQVDNY